MTKSTLPIGATESNNLQHDIEYTLNFTYSRGKYMLADTTYNLSFHNGSLQNGNVQLQIFQNESNIQ